MENYTITKEQIIQLEENGNANTSNSLKEWYGDAFKSELEVGKVYKSDIHLIFIEKIEYDKHYYYGFYRNTYYNNDNNDNYIVNIDCLNNLQLVEDNSWEDALIKEAVKRYKGKKVNCCHLKNSTIDFDAVEKMNFDGICLRAEGSDNVICLFDENGVWAKSQPKEVLITLEERVERLEEQLKSLK